MNRPPRQGVDFFQTMHTIQIFNTQTPKNGRLGVAAGALAGVSWEGRGGHANMAEQALSGLKANHLRHKGVDVGSRTTSASGSLPGSGYTRRAADVRCAAPHVQRSTRLNTF